MSQAQAPLSFVPRWCLAGLGLVSEDKPDALQQGVGNMGPLNVLIGQAKRSK